MTRFAISILSYNRPMLVQKTIKSVIEQTCQDFKLYIIDNNSREDVKNILREWKAAYPDKIVLHFFNTKREDRMRKCWISIMINWGIKNSTEPYVGYLSDDMWYHPQRLESMGQFIDENPKVKVIYGTQITMKKDGKIIRTRPAKDILQQIHQGIAGEQILYHRSLIDEIGYWNEGAGVNTYMDREFLSRITYPKYPVLDAINYELEHYKRWTRLMKKGKTAKTELIDGSLME